MRFFNQYDGNTDHLRTRTEIHVLPVHDRHTHALSRNTKHWTIDSQVCFYRRLFMDAVKPRGCISWHWGASIGLHSVPGGSSRQYWPCNSLCHRLKVQHCSLSLNGCFSPPSASHPPPPPPHPPPTRPPPINSIRDITGVGKKHLKNQQHLDSL